MLDYSDKLFNSGYLITNKDIRETTLLTQKIKNWTSFIFGGYHLFFSNNTKFHSAKSNDLEILIFGFVIDPFMMESNIAIICKSLLQNLKISENKFLDYLDNLSGRFTIITNNQGNLKVYGDTCHTKTIFYSFNDENFVVASHAALAAEAFELEKNPDSIYVLNAKNFTGRKFLPGLLSPFKNLYPLLPNTCLNIKNQSTERFFPRENLKNETSLDSLVVKITQILINQSALLSEHPNIYVSLTAGLDSRITFATFKNIKMDNIQFFTHTSIQNEVSFSEDLHIAQELCKLKNYKHNLIKYSTEITPELKKYKNIWYQNVGMNRGSASLFKAYTDYFPKNTLHIRSNIAEIARSFYQKNNATITPEILATMYTKSDFKDDPIVIQSFEKFIIKSKFSESYFFNYHYEDLFYWEHRMPMWHSWIVNEGDTAFETFVPFNNRRLLKLMLSTERSLRDSDELFIKILKKLDSELLQLPVNKNMIG